VALNRGVLQSGVRSQLTAWLYQEACGILRPDGTIGITDLCLPPFFGPGLCDSHGCLLAAL